jgi:hypothetical protein
VENAFSQPALQAPEYFKLRKPAAKYPVYASLQLILAQNYLFTEDVKDNPLSNNKDYPEM